MTVAASHLPPQKMPPTTFQMAPKLRFNPDSDLRHQALEAQPQAVPGAQISGSVPCKMPLPALVHCTPPLGCGGRDGGTCVICEGMDRTPEGPGDLAPAPGLPPAGWVLQARFSPSWASSLPLRV